MCQELYGDPYSLSHSLSLSLLQQDLLQESLSSSSSSMQLPVHGNKITLAHKYATILRTSSQLLVASAANSFTATPPGH